MSCESNSKAIAKIAASSAGVMATTSKLAFALGKQSALKFTAE